MANIKISELNELQEVDNDDLFVIVDTSSNETKKVKAENVSSNLEIHDSYSTSTIEPYSANYVNNNIPDISNVYGTSQEDGYSQEYINNKINEITAKSCKFTEMYKTSTVSVAVGETKSIGTLVMETHGKPLMVFASVNSKTANNNGGCSFYVDGVSNRSMITIGPSQHEYNDMAIVTNVEAGTHTFELKIKADSNSGTIIVYPFYINSFTVIEL